MRMKRTCANLGSSLTIRLTSKADCSGKETSMRTKSGKKRAISSMASEH